MAKSLGYDTEKEMWEDLYVREGWPISRLSEKLGYGMQTIARRIRWAGLEVRNRGGANNPARLRKCLFRLDQRFALQAPVALVARIIRSSESTVFKYRQSVFGVNYDQLLHNRPRVGIEQVCSSELNTPGLAPGSRLEVLGVLLEDEIKRRHLDPGQWGVRGDRPGTGDGQDGGSLPPTQASVDSLTGQAPGALGGESESEPEDERED